MKKSQLKKLIRKTIKESQLGAFQPKETSHDLDPQDLEYYLDQIQGMPTDEAIVYLGGLGLTSGQAKKVISQLDTEVSDMFRGHSDYEDPFPSTKKGIGDLDKFDLYESKFKKMKKSQLRQIIKEELRSVLKEDFGLGTVAWLAVITLLNLRNLQHLEKSGGEKMSPEYTVMAKALDNLVKLASSTGQDVEKLITPTLAKFLKAKDKKLKK